MDEKVSYYYRSSAQDQQCHQLGEETQILPGVASSCHEPTERKGAYCSDKSVSIMSYFVEWYQNIEFKGRPRRKCDGVFLRISNLNTVIWWKNRVCTWFHTSCDIVKIQLFWRGIVKLNGYSCKIAMIMWGENHDLHQYYVNMYSICRFSPIIKDLSFKM